MPVYTVSNAAERDLKEIGRYTQKKWGIEQRNSYLKMLDECFIGIASGRIEGRDCSAIRDGYRKHLAGRHLIFYRWLSSDLVEVVRVLHDRMNIDKNLSD